MADEANEEFRALQAERNAASAGNWENAEGHRRRVTELLESAAEPGDNRGRLCVLGAGNSSDLDLKRLAGRFREITLVDLDGAALSRGLARQGCTGRPEFRSERGCDVTGAT